MSAFAAMHRAGADEAPLLPVVLKPGTGFTGDHEALRKRFLEASAAVAVLCTVLITIALLAALA